MTVRLEVYLLESTLAFDRLYTYLADETLPGGGQCFRRGMFVVVPFGAGNRANEAVVWNVLPDDGSADTREPDGAGSDAGNSAGRPVVLKHILKVPDEEPLTEEELEFCSRLWRAYACTPGTAIRCVRPFRGKSRAVKRTVKVAELAIGAEEARELIRQTKLRSIWQLKLLELLAERGSADVEKLLFEAEAKPTHLGALVKKGYVKLSTREAGAEDVDDGPGAEREMLATYPEHQLNPRQEEAFNAVKAAIDANMTRGGEGVQKGGVFLLHGVTGSGKTEVYMHLISYVLSRGGYVIMMVPEIALTPQMIAHFTARFGASVALWHSGLGDAVREREWYRMKKGIAHVAVCTRSGIFAPFPQVDLVIADEVHDSSYRSEDSGLRYDAKEVAELRFAGKAAVLYGSATPDVSMYYRAEQGQIRLLELPSRAGAGKLPEIQVADMRDERAVIVPGRGTDHAVRRTARIQRAAVLPGMRADNDLQRLRPAHDLPQRRVAAALQLLRQSGSGAEELSRVRQQYPGLRQPRHRARGDGTAQTVPRSGSTAHGLRHGQSQRRPRRAAPAVPDRTHPVPGRYADDHQRPRFPRSYAGGDR